MNSEVREILTVGHSNHEEADFLALIEGARVELVADVRRHPSSRRLPHFDRSALAAALKVSGIEYEWMGESLGGRRDPVAGSGNDAWRDDAARGYADHMRSPQFEAGLDQLELLARQRRVAILCAEADWRQCHRRLISDALLAREWRVAHLRETAAIEPHELTEFALIEEGRVSYPAVQTSLDV